MAPIIKPKLFPENQLQMEHSTLLINPDYQFPVASCIHPPLCCKKFVRSLFYGSIHNFFTDNTQKEREMEAARIRVRF